MVSSPLGCLRPSKDSKLFVSLVSYGKSFWLLGFFFQTIVNLPLSTKNASTMNLLSWGFFVFANDLYPFLWFFETALTSLTPDPD
jgi:hypothetical protein